MADVSPHDDRLRLYESGIRLPNLICNRFIQLVGNAPANVVGLEAAQHLSIRALTSVTVFEANDIVFTEVAARLHLDDVQGDLPGVLDAMTNPDRNVGGLVLLQQECFLAER